ncbi:hypothetical protein E5288_WYG017875 [Bos mutus]|uniref:Uncharacterized protein n=1 Tax=Bos mutus TaxID=72004 RepID=A0A6B0S7W9_9CETA|nr:hypothetical protein [Bos mutus]
MEIAGEETETASEDMAAEDTERASEETGHGRDFPGRLFSASFLTRLLSLAIKCQRSQDLFLLILLVRTLSLGNLTYDPDSSQSSMEDSFRGLVSHQTPLMSSGSILSLTVLPCGYRSSESG